MTQGSYEEAYHQARHGRLLRDARRYRLSEEIGKRKYGPWLRGRVLEVGCGVGRNLSWLPGAVGVDLSLYALGAAKERGVARVAAMKADQLAFGDAQFDSVLLAHVLEHMPAPLAVLTEIARVLPAGGRLVIGLPLQEYKSAEVDQHLFVWGERELTNLLGLAGFTVVACGRHGYRLKGVLSRLRVPLGVAVPISRFLGRVALLAGIRSGPMEMICVAERTSPEPT